ncbi:DNA-directed RNA polymerase specialized sigma subunit [Paenibacillus forsythiae]|uniref:DNA-directed RNA polymerase specialized sigma subunit n=1 Tax=Paenibacillus forsythiae TaxID=365616 RepID=A0ABU3H237_9BACL|nr:sigma factor-like helix-turn-helix DNA-binding protein [Paenibacillus forsythiae]MDT3424879.1 DNA-directed RNA polymerase specialized sigma subunit [Paenibacillus forsythiae]
MRDRQRAGISRSYVTQIEKQALMKLYHEFFKQKK